MRAALNHGRFPAAIVVSAAMAIAGCGTQSDGISPAAEVSSTPLEAAADTCDAGRIADNGRTLLVDTQGEEDATGDSMDDLVCLLLSLDTPTAVIDHMSSTRALDGMQTNSWDEFDARWNYHPNSGMGLTITLRD